MQYNQHIQDPNRCTDEQIIEALKAGKTRATIIAELKTNARRVNILAKKISTKKSKERITAHYYFTKYYQPEHYIMGAF